MNTPFVLAQAPTQAPGAVGSPRLVQLAKPQGNQAVTVQLDGSVVLDFSRIADQTITMVRVGDKLIVLFDNQATITIGPVFGADGQPLAGVSFELAPDRVVTGAEFATLFPISMDQSVLPAA